jgi:hypothetical protein
MIGLGLTLTYRSYGRVLPSLSTYPVIDSFSPETKMLINDGSVDDLQKQFCSGALHPPWRDSLRQSLLHIRRLFRGFCTLQSLVKSQANRTVPKAKYVPYILRFRFEVRTNYNRVYTLGYRNG